MTRESEKSKIRMSVIVDGKHINSLKKADEVIDKIFDEHEAELKQAYIDGSNSNNGLIKFYLKQIEEKDKEIEKLISIVEEAIRKPMGVEPHSWSDYKIKKATT